MVFVSGEKLVTLDPHDPSMMTLNHSLGTSPVTYDTAGWIKACRNHPSSEQAVTLLNSSQKYVYMDWLAFYSHKSVLQNSAMFVFPYLYEVFLSYTLLRCLDGAQFCGIVLQ